MEGKMAESTPTINHGKHVGSFNTSRYNNLNHTALVPPHNKSPLMSLPNEILVKIIKLAIVNHITNLHPEPNVVTIDVKDEDDESKARQPYLRAARSPSGMSLRILGTCQRLYEVTVKLLFEKKFYFRSVDALWAFLRDSATARAMLQHIDLHAFGLYGFFAYGALRICPVKSLTLRCAPFPEEDLEVTSDPNWTSIFDLRGVQRINLAPPLVTKPYGIFVKLAQHLATGDYKIGPTTLISLLQNTVTQPELPDKTYGGPIEDGEHQNCGPVCNYATGWPQYLTEVTEPTDI